MNKEKIIELVENYLQYNEVWMWCWLEDLWITDRYEAMEYWYNEAMREVLELLNNL